MVRLCYATAIDPLTMHGLHPEARVSGVLRGKGTPTSVLEALLLWGSFNDEGRDDVDLRNMVWET
jgi:hypothetical protein